jgi:hypothetical protein
MRAFLLFSLFLLNIYSATSVNLYNQDPNEWNLDFNRFSQSDSMYVKDNATIDKYITNIFDIEIVLLNSKTVLLEYEILKCIEVLEE